MNQYESIWINMNQYESMIINVNQWTCTTPFFVAASIWAQSDWVRIHHNWIHNWANKASKLCQAPCFRLHLMESSVAQDSCGMGEFAQRLSCKFCPSQQFVDGSVLRLDKFLTHEGSSKSSLLPTPVSPAWYDPESKSWYGFMAASCPNWQTWNTSFAQSLKIMNWWKQTET